MAGREALTRKLGRLLAALLSFGIVWLIAGPALALDPKLDISQYKQTRWTVEDGAPSGISALAQGASGYLWIGTSAGLYRFDGVSFEQIRRRDGSVITSISSLLVAENGDVWIGYASGGSSIFRGGTLQDVNLPANSFVMNLVETRDHSIWAILGNNRNPLVRFQNGRWTDVSRAFDFPSEQPVRMIAARDGTLWISTLRSVLFLRRGAQHFDRLPVRVLGHASLAEDKLGNIWMSDQSGSRIVAPAFKSPAVASAVYVTPSRTRGVTSLVDRDGNLWGLADDGLFRVSAPRSSAAAAQKDANASVTIFRAIDGLLGNRATTMLEDREGSIWVGLQIGLQRFRPAALVREPSLRKIPLWGDVLFAASDGTIYLGQADAIYRVLPSEEPRLLFRASEPQAICEGPDAAIWIVTQDRVVRFDRGRFSSIRNPIKTDARTADCAVDQQNRIWLAATRLGFFQQTTGGWRQFPPSRPANLSPVVLQRLRNGSLLAGFIEGGLAQIGPHGTMKVLVSPQLTFGAIDAVLETPDGLLISGQFGLSLFRDGRLRTIGSARVAQFRRVAGIAQTPDGNTWFNTADGIIQLPTATLLRAFGDPDFKVTPTVLDYRDGLMSSPGGQFSRASALGGDGRIWFTTNDGPVWLDPKRIPRNPAPPPVAISSVRAKGETFRDPVAVRLRQGTSKIEIAFAALSLSIPQRVQVRYKLDGADDGWIDPGMRRQAFYTNLGPGNYRFRVIAANNDGVWNRQGATLVFDIPPTFLQSKWFAAICIAALCLLIWAVYRTRLRQMQGKMRAMLEQRLSERERIARDLHDTLLQGFQGLVMQFQSVANTIPPGERTRRLLDRALDQADDVLTEGRDSVQQLRAADVPDLTQVFTELADRLQQQLPAKFQLSVEGIPRNLHPVVMDEIGRIGVEALTNAFRHAKATKIELAMMYQASTFTLRVRDDGAGIPLDILEKGERPGHFGLIGIRERAAQIHADFRVSSQMGAGTEILVTVPARVAFVTARRGWRQLLERLT